MTVDLGYDASEEALRDSPAFFPKSGVIMPDDTLVQRSQRGDKAAFQALLDLYEKKIYAVVYRITRSHEDSEDVMQDAFLKAYTHLGRFEGRAKFSTWLTAIAINHALMVLRKRRNYAMRVISAVDELQTGAVLDVPDMRPNAEEVLLRVDLMKSILNAINQLPASLGSAFRTRYTNGLDTKEAASALGLSTTAVKSRVNRARRRLQMKFSSTHLG